MSIFKNKRIIIIVAISLVLFLATIVISLKVKAKSISVFNENNEYILGGQIVGVKLLASGVLVMGVDREDIDVKIGDIILEVNGKKVETDNDLKDYASLGEKLNLKIQRQSNIFNVEIVPEFSNNSKEYKLGLWVKDSSAGVGTITFLEKNSMKFAALGHAIYEATEDYVLPITTGCITDTQIFKIKKGYAKNPGELKGNITNNVLGNIYTNSQNGIYGKLSDDSLIDYSQTIKIASKDKIEEGEAYVYATLDDNIKKKYKINIEKIFLNSTDNKNMTIKVVDEELLEKTGGIVQGMSGAPIVQNGKLIGCVTHVLLDNPQIGYGAFIENMIKELSKI